jgi:hypothetical protein
MSKDFDMVVSCPLCGNVNRTTTLRAKRTDSDNLNVVCERCHHRFSVMPDELELAGSVLVPKKGSPVALRSRRRPFISR